MDCQTCDDLVTDYRNVVNLFKDAVQNSMEARQANRKIWAFLIRYAVRGETCNALPDDYKKIVNVFWEDTCGVPRG